MTLPSLWQVRHPHHPRPGRSPEGTWDTVVVGAGITGATTALLLARAGQRVLLLEAREVGAGSTGRSTAKLSLLQGTRLSQLARRHGPTVVGHYLDLHREGQAWLTRFADEHGVAVQRRPAYTFAATGNGEARARAELWVAQEAGLAVEWVDQPPLPFESRGAVRLADQAQLDPMELLGALIAQGEDHGVTLVEGARVRKVRGDGPIQVETTAGTARAAHVVLATNMPILDRGGFFARAKPSRSYALAFRSPELPDGMYLSADTPTVSLRDTPAGHGEGALLLIGGHGHGTGRSAPTSRHLDQLRRWTHEHYPAAEEVAAWSAQDFQTHHGLPYLGPLLPGSDILVAGGYAKWGITGGAGAAVALAARVLGGHVPWADALQPWSRQELTGTPSAALINAEVGVELVRGWVRPLRRGGQGRLVCSHMGGILTWNDAEQSWDCPLHGSRFDPDGEVLEGPAVCPVRRRLPV